MITHLLTPAATDKQHNSDRMPSFRQQARLGWRRRTRYETQVRAGTCTHNCVWLCIEASARCVRQAVKPEACTSACSGPCLHT